MRIWFSARQHNVNRLFQSLCTTIVKVGSSVGDVSQRWSFEGTSVFRFVSDFEPANVGLFGVHANTDVVILLIGEQHAIVAVVALDRLEDIPTAPSALTDRSVVASLPTVPGCVATDDSSFVRRNRFYDVVRSGVALKTF